MNKRQKKKRYKKTFSTCMETFNLYGYCAIRPCKGGYVVVPNKDINLTGSREMRIFQPIVWVKYPEPEDVIKFEV